MNTFGNEEYFQNVENKVNFVMDVHHVPVMKNQIARENLSNTFSTDHFHLPYVEKLREKLIAPNCLDKKMTIHVTEMKRKFQEQRDQEVFKKKFLNYDAEYQVERTFKYLEDEVNAKFRNVKTYYEFNKYLGSKMKKYDKRINLADQKTKRCFFESIRSLSSVPLITRRGSVASTISSIAYI